MSAAISITIVLISFTSLGIPELFGAVLISLVSTLLAIPPVRRIALHYRWVDCPDGKRKLHRGAIVCVGGIAILVGAATGLIYLTSIANVVRLQLEMKTLAVIAGALAMFVMGLADDVRGLGFKSKLIIQTVTAVLLTFAGFRLDIAGVLYPDPGGAAEILNIPATVLWIVGIVNAMNFIDGLDGLAAGLSLISLVSLAIVFGLGGEPGLIMFVLPVVGAAGGFLIPNFNPATLFMGNSGSYLLGFVLASYSIHAPAHANPLISLVIVVVILGVPIVDTALAILRRCSNGTSPFHPDRGHIHHQLVKLFSHRKAVIILYLDAVSLGLMGIAMAESHTPTTALYTTCAAAAMLVPLVLVGRDRSGRRESSRPRAAKAPTSKQYRPVSVVIEEEPVFEGVREGSAEATPRRLISLSRDDGRAHARQPALAERD